jgi:hypothetical protein
LAAVAPISRSSLADSGTLQVRATERDQRGMARRHHFCAARGGSLRIPGAADGPVLPPYCRLGVGRAHDRGPGTGGTSVRCTWPCYASSAPRKTRPAFARPRAASSAWPSRPETASGFRPGGSPTQARRVGPPPLLPTPRRGRSWAKPDRFLGAPGGVVAAHALTISPTNSVGPYPRRSRHPHQERPAPPWTYSLGPRRT